MLDTVFSFTQPIEAWTEMAISFAGDIYKYIFWTKIIYIVFKMWLSNMQQSQLVQAMAWHRNGDIMPINVYLG